MKPSDRIAYAVNVSLKATSRTLVSTCGGAEWLELFAILDEQHAEIERLKKIMSNQEKA